MPDEDPILKKADKIRAQMRAAIERIRSRFNQTLDEELERSESLYERGTGAN